MTISEAITTLSFYICGDWNFYIYSLTDKELAEEMQDINEAWKVLDENNIPVSAVRKHWQRHENRVAPPVRFIDRPHFIAVEDDELPF